MIATGTLLASDPSRAATLHAFARARASRSGAVLDLNISPEALTPRQTLSQMRAAALAAKDEK